MSNWRRKKGWNAMKRFVFGSLAVVGMLATSAPSAGAYGNAGPAKQTYQLTFSQNCNSPSVCGDELGGFWGWAVLYSDGTGDAELTGCGHLTHGGGPGTAGAGHFHDDFTYDLSNTTELVTISETETFVGHGQPVTETVPGEATGIPLVPGHYSTTDLLGFSAPGVSFQIQVVQLH
jgi:hypothetical protein